MPSQEVSGSAKRSSNECRWKDSPKTYGPRKTPCNRFVLWAENGIWDRLCHHAAAAEGLSSAVTSDAPTAMLIARRLAEKRAKAQAAGRSRGRRTTKLHAAVHEYGRARQLNSHDGHRGDAPVTLDLAGQMTPRTCIANATCGGETRSLRHQRSIPAGTHTRSHPGWAFQIRSCGG